MKKIIFLIAILFFIGTTAAFLNWDTDQGSAAIIKLDGQISPGGSDPLAGSSLSPEQVRSLNSRAISQGADAIIYEWNSGGGAVVASKEILRSIESVNIPTICRIRDIGASGAYLASLGCDHIIADPASMTGSIGVTSSYLQFSGLMDKYGVEYVNISAGEYKEIGSPYQNITEEEKEILQEKTEIIHEEFLSLVQENRNISQEQMEEIETGELFLGSEAKELGLIDTLGGRKTAVEEAENITEKELSTFQVESQQSLSFLQLLTMDSWLEPLINTDSLMKAEWR